MKTVNLKFIYSEWLNTMKKTKNKKAVDNMKSNRNKIVLHFNGKYTSGYEYTSDIENLLPVILLCHGNYREGKDSKIMLSMAETFANNGFIAFSFDNLGYNQAWRPENDEIHSAEEIDLRWTTYLAVSYIKNKYKAKQIVVVGHSMGASIALAVGALSDSINKIIAISPTRISAFITDDDKLLEFWKNSNNIGIRMNVDTIRSIRFDIMEENYIPFLQRKKTLFICGNKERYLGYKHWIEEFAANVGNNCVIIPNADHFFCTYENSENTDVFETLMSKIITWIDSGLNNTDVH
jgi:pimeloyl-ACP methyl ester carboxylesterase